MKQPKIARFGQKNSFLPLNDQSLPLKLWLTNKQRIKKEYVSTLKEDYKLIIE